MSMAPSTIKLPSSKPSAPDRSSAGGRSTKAVRALRSVLLHLFVFAGVIGSWSLASNTVLKESVFIPAPIEIARAFSELFDSPTFMKHVQTTATETVVGFVVGALVGIALGTAMHYLPLFGRLVNPYVIGFQVMPKVVLAPLFVAWLGFGMEPKIVTAATMVFFPVLVNTMLGLSSVDPDAEELLRSIPAGRIQVFTKLAVPSALPAITAGLLTGATLAPIGAVVAEFISAQYGLGQLLVLSLNQLAVPRAFAIILTISAMSFALFALVRLFHKKVVFWDGGA